MSKQPSDEELISTMSSYNERAPDRWRAQFELDRRAALRAAEEAGRSTFWWTVIGAWAAIVAAVVSIIALYFQWPK